MATLVSSQLQNTVSTKNNQSAKRKFEKQDFLLEMNENDKELNHKIIKQMNKRINYLRNPRFKTNQRPIMFQDLIYRQDLVDKVNNAVTSFHAIPQNVIFRDYMINNVYEINLKLINVSNILKRIKFMPPQKSEFNVGEIIYPSKEDGYVASGMSVIFKIRFNPSSFAEFDDELTILTEENIFKIPILARKEPPCLNLPQNLDCKSCWLGDQIDVRFKVTNTGGEAGYRFFKVSEQKDQPQEQEFIQLNNFIITPVEFFLQKNETQEIQVIFKPDQEGEILDEIILGCDNQTNASLKLKGSGNTVELGIAAIDDNNLELLDVNQITQSSKENFQKIFFKNAIPNQESQRTLKIRNKTSVKVKYHWSLFKQDISNNEMSLNDEDFYFKIDPFNGEFQPDEIVTFTISLKSDLYYPLFEYANLIIDEIPFESIRNPPESLKNFSSDKLFGSNSTRPSITYFEFELISFSSLCEASVNPPFYVFPWPLYVSQQEKKLFQLSNLSNCPLNYEISVNYKSNESVKSYIEKEKGKIEATSSAEIILGLSSDQVGENQKIVYRIDFDYCDSLSLEMIANFQAPKIRVLESWVNFGLTKANSQTDFLLHVENLSYVPAQVSLRSLTYNPKINFSQENFIIHGNGQTSLTISFFSGEPETFKDLMSITVDNGDQIILEIFAEVQSPSVSLNRVALEIECLYCGNTYTFDERAQQYITIQNLGNIATPFLWEVPEDQERFIIQFEPKSGVIQPKQNLPVKFSIKPKQGGELNEIFVCDVEGLQFPLGFELKTKVFGLSVEYELIEEDTVFDAKDSVSQSSRKSPNATPTKRKSFFRQSFMQKTQLSKGSSKSRKSQVALDIDEEQPSAIKTQKMEKLDFYNCTINRPRQVKFVLKNLSGIHTQFRFFMETYEPYYDSVTQEDEKSSNPVGTKSLRFAATDQKMDAKSSNSKSIIKKGKITQDGRPTVLLTDRIEKTRNFTSAQGQQLNHQKKLESDQRIFLSNNLGVALQCDPCKGALPAYGSVVITVTVFNDICGLFKDWLCSEIRGLETKKFDVLIDVKGSPVIIGPNQLGVNYKGEIPYFDLGAFMRNSGGIAREFRVTNTGPKDIELEWKMYNLSEISNSENLFDIKFCDPALGSDRVCDVQFLAKEPPEAVEGPFIVHPKKEKIRGRKEKHFTINFQTGDIGSYNACLVAQPRLVNKTAEEDSQVGLISLYLKARTIKPELYLDKLANNDEGDQYIKFIKFSNGKNARQEKCLCLVNQKESGFICSVELEGPFKFLSTSTNSPQKYELGQQSLVSGPLTTFNLVQNSHIELKIMFEGPNASNLQEWPMSYKVYKYGSLNIFFVNGDSQKIKLEGVLLRPYVHLNTSGIHGQLGQDVIDFKEVHINDKKTMQIFLSNLSQVPASWKLTYVKYPMKKNLVPQTMTLQDKEDQLKTDDQSVFEFQITEVIYIYYIYIPQGSLQGPSTMVHTLPHASALPHTFTVQDILDLGIEPFKILINFRPKKNILYKSKYRISVQDGISVDFVLKGFGTYDENKEKFI